MRKACLLVHEGNSLRRQRQPTLGDCSGLRWILPPRDSPTAQAIAAAFAAANQTLPQAVLRTASTKLVHAMVGANTDMVAVLPLDIGTDLERLSGVVVLPFPASFYLPPVGLIAPRRHWDQSRLVALRKTLRGLVATGACA
jgi:DNA-binding transcriptional LysR family regulator